MMYFTQFANRFPSQIFANFEIFSTCAGTHSKAITAWQHHHHPNSHSAPSTISSNHIVCVSCIEKSLAAFSRSHVIRVSKAQTTHMCAGSYCHRRRRCRRPSTNNNNSLFSPPMREVLNRNRLPREKVPVRVLPSVPQWRFEKLHSTSPTTTLTAEWPQGSDPTPPPSSTFLPELYDYRLV